MVRQGEVYWIDGAEPAGSEAGFRRPWVVVQNNEANESGLATVVLAAMTSNLRFANLGGNVEIPAGRAGLRRTSVVVVSQLETVDRRFLPSTAGTLSIQFQRRIANGVQALVEPSERG